MNVNDRLQAWLVLGPTKYENDCLQSWLILRFTGMKMIVTNKMPPLREGWSYPAACIGGRSQRIKVILFSRLYWSSILEGEGDLIQPHIEGRSLRLKVILFSRLHWRSIPKDKGDLIQPLILKVDPWGGRKKVILFSRLHWRSIPEVESDLIQPLTLKVDP